jgi:hypothetical protein
MFRIKVFYQFFHRCHTSYAFVCLYVIVIVCKTYKFFFPVISATELCSFVPHLYERSDYSFYFSSCSWSLYLCESLFNSILSKELFHPSFYPIAIFFIESTEMFFSLFESPRKSKIIMKVKISSVNLNCIVFIYFKICFHSVYS